MNRTMLKAILGFLIVVIMYIIALGIALTWIRSRA